MPAVSIPLLTMPAVISSSQNTVLAALNPLNPICKLLDFPGLLKTGRLGGAGMRQRFPLGNRFVLNGLVRKRFLARQVSSGRGDLRNATGSCAPNGPVSGNASEDGSEDISRRLDAATQHLTPLDQYSSDEGEQWIVKRLVELRLQYGQRKEAVKVAEQTTGEPGGQSASRRPGRGADRRGSSFAGQGLDDRQRKKKRPAASCRGRSSQSPSRQLRLAKSREMDGASYCPSVPWRF